MGYIDLGADICSLCLSDRGPFYFDQANNVMVCGVCYRIGGGRAADSADQRAYRERQRAGHGGPPIEPEVRE